MFIVMSFIYMESKLRKISDEVVVIVVEVVKYVCLFGCDDVEFFLEDVGRFDFEFLYCILSVVVEVGVMILNILDTVGICLSDEFG